MFLKIPIHDMRINAGDNPKIRSVSEAHTSLETLVNERTRCVADASSPGQAERPSATVSHRGGSRMTAPFRYAPPQGVASDEEPARHLPLVAGGQGRSAKSVLVSAFVVVGAIVAAMLVVAWEATP